jgi:glycosyltransferase involved in cell wall biosynthesis
MKILIILPFKEAYSKVEAGAVSIMVNTHLKYSKYKNSTLIHGSAINNPLNKKFFVPIKKSIIFKNKSYIKKIESLIDNNIDAILEIHNRPEYFLYLKEKFPHKKFILFFHNDPNDLDGSTHPSQREFIFKNCNKIIFLSEWIKKQFLKDTNITDCSTLIVFYPGIKQINEFPAKKNIILFVGKLNYDKGYDIYLDAVKIFLKKFPKWKSLSAGTEKRRIIEPNISTTELGQISNSQVLKIYESASIVVANSTRNEPLGRSPIEASSRGCVSIVSKRGGLIETLDSNSIILKKNTPLEISKNLSKLASNIKKLRKRQTNIFNSFKYNLRVQSMFMDNIRNSLSKKINSNVLKIIHITNFNDRFDGRLHFNSGKKFHQD